MTTTTSNINELIILCKKGNQKAQYDVYNLYYKAMYNISLRIVKDSHWAEDIMQEAFLKAFTKLDSFKGEVTFGAWLKRIVINHSLDNYKKLNKEDVSPLDQVLYKVEEDTETESNSIDFSLMQIGQVKEAINNLKENYRIILTLLYIEGYDQEEICDILNINPGNCRTTISRAKSSLLKKLSA
ncbi:RNA polymerase sigma factor [Flavobacterium litorale]|uniref:RNA polymerase sigma factor n=1 Tax=Flavobacterium litorale TaxID=2856519 RepID=A0ABX8V9B3_9FLAO|nr:RNA polymerase sigma factor [Flavobacterium litorale]QYJ67611.1 RNA polymerase sigma factor [Flavobacterium litorale]